MYELTEMEMQSINGGSALIYLIYVILGVGAYKLLRSKRGRMSLPRLIQIEWGQNALREALGLSFLKGGKS